MARQESLIQFTGTIGNIIFYKSLEGYLARKKGGISAKRIRSEPAFARTRENNAEFKRAVQASRVIRRAFAALLYQAADARVTGRLNGALVKVVRADAVNSRGERTVMDGDLSLLKGFNFNKNAKLQETFHAPFTATADHGSGAMVIDIPSFVPSKMINAPKGATHFRLKAGGAAIDFASSDFQAHTAESAELSLRKKIHEPLQLKIAVSPNSTRPFILVFGIEFLQIVNGVENPFKDATFNAMAVVAARRI